MAVVPIVIVTLLVGSAVEEELVLPLVAFAVPLRPNVPVRLPPANVGVVLLLAFTGRPGAVVMLDVGTTAAVVTLKEVEVEPEVTTVDVPSVMVALLTGMTVEEEMVMLAGKGAPTRAAEEVTTVGAGPSPAGLREDEEAPSQTP